MRLIFTICFLAVVGASLVTPFVVNAEGSGLIPCRQYYFDNNGNLKEDDKCEFGHIVQLVSNAINFLFFLTLPVIAIAVAYSGWQILVSQGNPSERAKALDRMKKIAMGFVWMLAAWLLITFLIKNLITDSGILNMIQSLIGGI